MMWNKWKDIVDFVINAYYKQPKRDFPAFLSCSLQEIEFYHTNYNQHHKMIDLVIHKLFGNYIDII